MKNYFFIGNRQSGFTLVEIMLAITLSLILIAGVIQVYLSSKTSFQVQGQLSRLQENQRISIEFLQRDVRQAGFVPFDRAPIPLNSRIAVQDGGGNASDTITVQYTSGTDCLGQTTPNGIAINEYFIDVDDQGNSLNRLMCRGNGNPNTPQPIADGINNMQILLGRDTVSSNNTIQMPSADFYVNRTTVASMTDVVSIRIALLVQSEQAIRKQNMDQTFTLLDAVVTPSDRFKRQVVTTTIPIRNRV